MSTRNTTVLMLLSAFIGGLLMLVALTATGADVIATVKRTLRNPLQECVDYANHRITRTEFNIESEGQLAEVLKVGEGFRVISIYLPAEDFGYFVRCGVSEGAGLLDWPTFTHASRIRPPF